MCMCVCGCVCFPIPNGIHTGQRALHQCCSDRLFLIARYAQIGFVHCFLWWILYREAPPAHARAPATAAVFSSFAALSEISALHLLFFRLHFNVSLIQCPSDSLMRSGRAEGRAEGLLQPLCIATVIKLWPSLDSFCCLFNLNGRLADCNNRIRAELAARSTERELPLQRVI